MFTFLRSGARSLLFPQASWAPQLVKSLAKEGGLRVEANRLAWTRPSEPRFSLILSGLVVAP